MMMTMLNQPTHHPSDERLLDYVSGAASETCFTGYRHPSGALPALPA